MCVFPDVVMSSLCPVQVLFLSNLSMSLGLFHSVRWKLPQEDLQRFDCYPDGNANETECLARGCIWKVSTDAHF